MQDGWVKLWRKSLDTSAMKNHKLWTFWTWCLLKASHTEHTDQVGFQDVDLLPGQFVFGRKKAASDINMSEQSIRTCLKALQKNKRIDVKPTSKFSIVTICKWEDYQKPESDDQPTANQQPTNNQPSSNHQVTTNNNDKKVKNDNNEKKKEKEILLEESFQKFYSNYPRKEKEKKCRSYWKNSVRKRDHEKIYLALEQYKVYVAAKITDSQYVITAYNYLKDERWNDEFDVKGVKQDEKDGRIQRQLEQLDGKLPF